MGKDERRDPYRKRMLVVRALRKLYFHSRNEPLLNDYNCTLSRETVAMHLTEHQSKISMTPLLMEYFRPELGFSCGSKL
jgi:hypothetical protein